MTKFFIAIFMLLSIFGYSFESTVDVESFINTNNSSGVRLEGNADYDLDGDIESDGSFAESVKDILVAMSSTSFDLLQFIIPSKISFSFIPDITLSRPMNLFRPPIF